MDNYKLLNSELIDEVQKSRVLLAQFRAELVVARRETLEEHQERVELQQQLQKLQQEFAAVLVRNFREMLEECCPNVNIAALLGTIDVDRGGKGEHSTVADTQRRQERRSTCQRRSSGVVTMSPTRRRRCSGFVSDNGRKSITTEAVEEMEEAETDVDVGEGDNAEAVNMEAPQSDAESPAAAGNELDDAMQRLSLSFTTPLRRIVEDEAEEDEPEQQTSAAQAVGAEECQQSAAEDEVVLEVEQKQRQKTVVPAKRLTSRVTLREKPKNSETQATQQRVLRDMTNRGNRKYAASESSSPNTTLSSSMDISSEPSPSPKIAPRRPKNRHECRLKSVELMRTAVRPDIVIADSDMLTLPKEQLLSDSAEETLKENRTACRSISSINASASPRLTAVNFDSATSSTPHIQMRNMKSDAQSTLQPTYTDISESDATLTLTTSISRRPRRNCAPHSFVEPNLITKMRNTTSKRKRNKP